MSTLRPNTSLSPRFTVTRADLSPLARRTTATPSARTASGVHSVVFSPVRRASAVGMENSGESRAFPSFWTSTALTRVQSEITRHHD